MVDPEQARQSNAIVIGHGRFGQAVAQIFAGANISVTLVDLNPDQIRLSGEFGRKVFYGDGTRIDLLRRAGAEQAGSLLFCMDDKNFGPDQIAPIAHAFPDAKIFVRANDRRQLLALEACTDCSGAARTVRIVGQTGAHRAAADRHRSGDGRPRDRRVSQA